MFITLLCASNKTQHQKELIENLISTAHTPNQIEILFLLDEGDLLSAKNLDELQNRTQVTIKYMFDNSYWRYIGVLVLYNQLLSLASKDSYFFNIISDKVRFETKHWDKKLKFYHSYFKDDLFRVCISKMKFNNYYRFKEALVIPENFSFVTRRWLEVAGGWGEFCDSGLEAMQYYLGKLKRLGVFRSVAAPDINIKEYNFSSSATTNSSIAAKRRSYVNYKCITSENAKFIGCRVRESFYRRAVKLLLYINNYEKVGSSFSFQENKKNKSIVLLNSNHEFVDVSRYKFPLEERIFALCEYISEVMQNSYAKLNHRNQIVKFFIITRSSSKIIFNSLQFFTKIPQIEMENDFIEIESDRKFNIENDLFIKNYIHNCYQKACNKITS